VTYAAHRIECRERSRGSSPAAPHEISPNASPSSWPKPTHFYAHDVPTPRWILSRVSNCTYLSHTSPSSLPVEAGILYITRRGAFTRQFSFAAVTR
jgi:hypothetical protein